jgi:hypothetical protein
VEPVTRAVLPVSMVSLLKKVVSISVFDSTSPSLI